MAVYHPGASYDRVPGCFFNKENLHMGRISTILLRLGTWITNLGKTKLDHADVHSMMVKEYFETEVACLQQTARAEYHDAMAAMLYHRRKRLVEDPFNKRFFDGMEREEAEDFVPPPPEKKTKGDGGPKAH